MIDGRKLATRRPPLTIRFAVMLSALSVFALVGYVIWSGAKANDRADSALDTLQQHDSAAAEDRAESAREIRQLQDKVDALFAFMRAHGLNPPARFVTVRQQVTVRKHVTVRHHRTRHRVHRPRVAPAGPGRSTHPHRHHRHRHHKRHR